MSLWKRGASKVFQELCRPAYRQFQQASESPHDTQRLLLNDILHLSSATEYGQSLSIKTTDSYEEFCKKVPLQNYDVHLAPWILKQQQESTKNIFCAGGASHFERTSGSSGRAKLIPYNQSARKTFETYFRIWAFDILENGPAFESFLLYMSISPSIGKTEERDSGFSDDSEYLSPLLRSIFSRFLAVPLNLKFIEDPEYFRQTLSAYLVNATELEIISIWHPSFFLVLLEYIENSRLEIARRLRADPTMVARREVLAKLESSCAIADFWPQLKFISAWDSGNSTLHAKRLQSLFPKTLFQGKGLLATEAPLTIPFLRYGALPFITDIFFEFKDESGNISLLSQVEENKKYRVILSHKGGFLRYELGDEVIIKGPYFKKLPQIYFLGRQSEISDLVGEKISASNIDELFVELSKTFPDHSFCLLPRLPQNGSPHYVLLHSGLPSTSSSLAEKTDLFLREHYHYSYARDLNQLTGISVHSVPDLSKQLLQFYVERRGMKLGDIKLKNLITKTQEASEIFCYLKIDLS